MYEKANNDIENEKEYNKKILKSVMLIEAINDTIDYLKTLAEKTDSIEINTVSGYYKNIKKHIIPYFGENQKMCEITSKSVKNF